MRVVCGSWRVSIFFFDFSRKNIGVSGVLEVVLGHPGTGGVGSLCALGVLVVAVCSWFGGVFRGFWFSSYQTVRRRGVACVGFLRPHAHSTGWLGFVLQYAADIEACRTA